MCEPAVCDSRGHALGYSTTWPRLQGAVGEKKQDRLLLRMRRKEWKGEILEVGGGLLKIPVSLASGLLGGLPWAVTTRPGQGERGLGGVGLAPRPFCYYQDGVIDDSFGPQDRRPPRADTAWNDCSTPACSLCVAPGRPTDARLLSERGRGLGRGPRAWGLPLPPEGPPPGLSFPIYTVRDWFWAKRETH